MQRLVALADDFHGLGLTRLVAMLQQWRGESFLESAAQDQVVGTLLRSHGPPSDEQAAAS